MKRQPQTYISAPDFHNRTGYTKMQAKRFRDRNEGKGLFRRNDKGRFEYNVTKLPQSLFKEAI